ncbi:hypothetical protein [Halorubrum sp. Ea1]|uniref:hypothetical protein n=1 Tax=Halorubrum sp. Ea1 TaxID=1480718 RepID=UPI001595436C|nr:hypothetical protein [Halorubrum sp. Ea1]
MTTAAERNPIETPIQNGSGVAAYIDTSYAVAGDGDEADREEQLAPHIGRARAE